MKEEYIQQYFYTPSREIMESSIYITWAGHRKCSPNHLIGPRMLDTYKLVFVISGSGYLEQGSNARQKLNAEDAFILFPRERHCYFANAQDPWELMWVAFNGPLCPLFLAPTRLTPSNCIQRHALTVGIQKSLTTLVNAMGDDQDVYRLRAVGYFYILLTKMAEETRSNQQMVRQQDKDEVIAKIITFVEQNYYNPLDLDIICDHVNYSRSFISQAFHQATGMTITEMIVKVRMKKAKLLLKQTDLPIKEVASSVGISDGLYFSKVFKKHQGMSPQAYRQEG